MRPFAVVLVLCLASSASAQNLEEARAIFEEGLEHSQRERWVPALEAFRISLEMAEMPVTLYNIASVLIRLGRMQEAVATLERYQAIAEPADRADADPLLEQARAAIRSVRASVDPVQTILAVDGAVVPGEGRVRLIRIDPGTHAVRGRAEGYEPNEITLDPTALELTLTLVPQLAVVMVRASESDARILLDGTERGTGEARLELDAGSYELRVEAEGTEPFARSLTLSPGERIDVEAALSRDEPLWKRGWFWGLIATAAVGIALVTTLSIILPLPAQPNDGTANWVVRP